MRKREGRRPRRRQRKCPYCRQWFLPDPRTAYRDRNPSAAVPSRVPYQRFCAQAACRQASHRLSQHMLVCRNPNVNAGKDNVDRVRAWRGEHPYYWRGQARGRTLDVRVRIRPVRGRPTSIRASAREIKCGALRDLCVPQPIDATTFTLGLVCALRDAMGFKLAMRYRPSCSEPGKDTGRGRTEGSAAWHGTRRGQATAAARAPPRCWRR